MIIESKKVVTLNYTLKNDAGDVLDTSDGQGPLAYIHGVGMMIPGLETELSGKTVGDKLNVAVPSEGAYGSRDEGLVQKVPLTQFDQPEQVIPGNQFEINGPQGPMLATIQSVEDDNVTVDLNHPLADMTLHFDVEIVEIRDATEEELSHGHVHGKGGVEH